MTSPNPFQNTLFTLNSANCNTGNELALNLSRFRASSNPALHSSRSESEVAVACKRSQRLHMVAHAPVHPMYFVVSILNVKFLPDCKQQHWNGSIVSYKKARTPGSAYR